MSNHKPAHWGQILSRLLVMAIFTTLGLLLNMGHWSFLFGFTAGVVWHEFGHWFCCRVFGIPVQTFSIGADTELIGIAGYVPPLRLRLGEVWGTQFQITPYLVGGLVDIDSRAFKQAAAWKRAIVLLGGVTMNAALALTIMIGLNATLGKPQPAAALVHGFSGQSSLAAASGLVAGDRITYIDGVRIKSAREAVDYIEGHAAHGDLTFNTERGRFTVARTESALGIQLLDYTEAHPMPLLQAVKSGAQDVRGMFGDLTAGVGMLVGMVQPPPGADVHLRSVVAVTQIGGALFDRGDWYHFLWFLAYLNVMLVIFNLLPFAHLDGGQLMQLAYEWFAGREMPAAARSFLQHISLGFLVAAGLTGLFSDFMFPILRQ